MAFAKAAKDYIFLQNKKGYRSHAKEDVLVRASSFTIFSFL